MIQHPIAPVYDEASNVLILGSFPSVKSREQGFFYGHPQNRFWRVAVWDVIASCDIQGSADSSIRNAQPTDLGGILAKGKIRQIYVNGRKAEQLYRKYQEKQTGLKAVCLPSTSPANAAWSVDRLVEAWKVIRE